MQSHETKMMETNLSNPSFHKDEISLIDIWRTLVKHKKLIFLVWALISLGGVIAAVLIPERYTYTTLLEVGSQVGGVLVETADAARVKLLAGIIPITQRRYLTEGKEAYGITVKVTIPEKSPSLLSLESQGTAQSASDHLAFQGDIAEALRQDHEIIFGRAREVLAARQEDVKRKIAELTDARALAITRLDRLDEEETAHLKKKIEQSRALLASIARPGERSLASRMAEEAMALTHMMAVNQIEQQRRTLATLEERLFLEMPEERAEISKALADNERVVEEQRGALNMIASDLGAIRETRALLPPTQSDSPVAPSRGLIVALAAIFGLMLGIFSAFIAESISKARKNQD